MKCHAIQTDGETGGINPRTLNVGAISKVVARFTPQSLLSLGTGKRLTSVKEE
jgi:hypothetical protein